MIRQFDMGDGVAGVALACAGSVNVLDGALNVALARVVDNLLADDAVKGLVLTSDKKDFAAGGDLGELIKVRQPEQAEVLIAPFLAMLRRIELSGKPVVAAMPGTALGGGLELALGCHRRIAARHPGARFGLPEVTLGLMPGGGGTQRLPRLIGLEAATPLLLEGTKLSVEQALELGVIDEVVEADDLLAAAQRWVLSGPEALQPWDRKSYVLPGPDVQSQAGRQFFMASWARVSRAAGGDPAKLAILQALQQGLQRSLDAGILIESRLFCQLAASAGARNRIRTLFTGVQQARAMTSRPASVPVRPAQCLAVIGGGVMGRGIAWVAAQAGLQVRLLDVDAAAARRAVDRIREQGERDEAKGRLRRPLASVMEAIVPVTEYADLAAADFVVEAVFEQSALKQDVLRQVVAVVGPDIPIASNTSTLPITGLAQAISTPQRLIGLHFFSPVDRMPLVEVVRAELTAETTLAHALDFLKQLGKTPVVVNDGLGFYTSRVVTSYSTEILTLLAEGVPPPWIDNVGTAAGFALGGASLLELTTYPLLKDILASMRGDGQRLANAGARAEEAVERLLAFGRVGKVGGGGVYDYDEQGRTVWPGLAEVFPPQASPDPQVLHQRLFYVQSLEAVRCLEEGVLTQPLDGDVAAVLGWGYPARLGGPFAYIDEVGVRQFVVDCDRLAAQFGARFTPARTLRDMAQTGATFYQ